MQVQADGDECCRRGSVAAGTWWPSAYVPLVEPRSRAIRAVIRDVDFQVLAGSARIVDDDIATGTAADYRLVFGEQVLVAVHLEHRAILGLRIGGDRLAFTCTDSEVRLKLPLDRSRSSSKITITGPTKA